MSKQAIELDGQTVVVREDTAKAFRGVNWAMMSLAAFIFILTAAILFVVFFMGVAKDAKSGAPANTADVR